MGRLTQGKFCQKVKLLPILSHQHFLQVLLLLMKTGLEQTNRLLLNSDDTPISTFDKDGVEGTVSPSLANTRSKISDVIETPDSPMKFENLEDFFSRVRGQIKRAQSLDLSTDQSSPIDDKISATQKSTPLAEMLATAKAPDLSAERALALEKLKENFPHFSLTLHRAKKDKVEYYKKAAKKSLLIDELIKNQELYTDLKDCSDKLEIQISKLEARVKDAKTKIEVIQEQKLTLANVLSEV
ncbi:hypothetical protein KY290_036555 [Solanum tuberosum]|uniref:Uncharacterized protein n=1 Tax=Solanum tuberosum TaxID=4113 RepID=A0ABQ7TTN4_SOLTU|nr:hypothetical protein KY289_036045 [Solanum tuberosum]KAH0639285.1 hypothetical protein KY285_035871 [Solanum tuberosum]KAH0737850.1 hypothetical protein KY290_036555 [Solanum tuberosum]